MAAIRNPSTSTTEAFSLAFGSASQGGSPAPFALDNPGTQEQAPAAAPQPSVAEISAATARLLQLPPDRLGAEIEKLAGMAMAESRARYKAEAELAAMRNTPAQQLARFKATGAL
jgi:hypothetical protein